MHDAGGRVWTTKEDIAKAFVDYFQSLFSSNDPTGIQDCLSVISPKVSSDINDSLIRPFVLEEIDTALRQMQSLKAPGPDGFGAFFFSAELGHCGVGYLEDGYRFLELGDI